MAAEARVSPSGWECSGSGRAAERRNRAGSISATVNDLVKQKATSGGQTGGRR